MGTLEKKETKTIQEIKRAWKTIAHPKQEAKEVMQE